MLAFALVLSISSPDPPLTAPAVSAAPPPPHDRYVITIPENPGETLALKDGHAGGGRLLLFFIHDGARLGRADPIEAPFYSRPQPVASIDLPDLEAGKSAVIDAQAISWPDSVDMLDGKFRVQACYRRNRDARSHQAEGNLYTAVKEVEVSVASADEITLSLDQVMHDEPLTQLPNLKWFTRKSERLSAFAGRDVIMRAGVVFPKGYDDLNAKRRIWPTIYVVPGFGGDHRLADNYARMMMTPGTEGLAPQAVYVVLDPDCPLGHSGFADSDVNGPRGESLVKEFIPALEERFRLVAKPEARIITGHSSGGWSSLWLQLAYPETFGACFASAPDPVDFSAFQANDLYHDDSMFVDADGNEQPSYRQPLGPEEDRVMMTVRDEAGVERVLGPRGDSGEQWGAWAAMFSSRDAGSGLPRLMFDPLTGRIDHAVVERDWARYDIAKRMESDWARYGPIIAERVRLVVGERDSYYLNRAVERLKSKFEALRRKDLDAKRVPPGGPGYIEIVPRATHESIVPLRTMRFNEEMVEHLRKHGLHE